MVTKPRTKAKKDETREWRRVYLIIAGKNLDPARISESLHILPDGSGKRGEPCGRNRNFKRGYWLLESGPSTWRIETQIVGMLKRIAPVKHRLRKLIKEDETVKEACLQIAFAPRRGIANACYCFDAELINEFTSMGIDIALSIQIIEEWERTFAKSQAKTNK